MKRIKEAALVASVGILSLPAMAEVDQKITTAISGGFDDAKGVAVLILGGLAAIFSIMLIRRFLR